MSDKENEGAAYKVLSEWAKLVAKHKKDVFLEIPGIGIFKNPVLKENTMFRELKDIPLEDLKFTLEYDSVDIVKNSDACVYSKMDDVNEIETVEEFRKEYNEEHAACPKCGSKRHSTTLVAYIINMSAKELYKDKNRCTCSDCGDVHITHDRIKISYRG